MEAQPPCQKFEPGFVENQGSASWFDAPTYFSAIYHSERLIHSNVEGPPQISLKMGLKDASY